MTANKDVRFYHLVEKRVVERMCDGQKISGVFNPAMAAEDWADNGREEIADLINYMRMEGAELVCLEQPDDPVTREELLTELREMESAAKGLGARLEAYHEKRWKGDRKSLIERNERTAERMKRGKRETEDVPKN